MDNNQQPHRAPGSSPPLVGLAVREVVPGTGVGRGRERTGLGGAGRALGHGAVLLRGGTVVRVALAGIHLLVAEVDAQNLPRRLPLAARHRALGGGEQREIGPVSARLILDLLFSWIFYIFRVILFTLRDQRKSPRNPKPELSGTTTYRCNLEPTRVESTPPSQHRLHGTEENDFLGMPKLR